MVLLWFPEWYYCGSFHIGLVGLHFKKIPYYCFNKFGMKVELKACAQPTVFKQKSYDSVNNQGRHYYPHFFFFKGETEFK